MTSRYSHTLLDLLTAAMPDVLQDKSIKAAVRKILISSLTADSRALKKGALFVAFRGAKNDGRSFIDAALQQGASAVIYEASHGFSLPAKLQTMRHVIEVKDINNVVGKIAAKFYDYPSRDVTLIGITGTNGKTTIAYLMAQMLDALHLPAGMIGTLGAGKIKIKSPHKTADKEDVLASTGMTTPNAIDLQKWLASLKTAELKAVCLEVSSHGLALSRVDGTDFDYVVLSNFSQDHLDFHASMAEYAEAKTRLFTDYAYQRAIVNQDDALGEKLIAQLGEKAISYGLHKAADVAASKIVLSENGLHFTVCYKGDEVDIRSSLIGEFNVYNMLAVIAAGLAMGYALAPIAKALLVCRSAPGRMEKVGAQINQITVVVDYAHTPDALEKALLACQSHCLGELSVVFGCGGDRDQAKRPLMGKLAEQLADQIYLTDDNPRDEPPAKIVADIISGMQQAAWILHDRAVAISTAIHNAKPNDWVLIAGKGHESGQIYQDKILPFDDKTCAENVLERLAA